MPHRLSKSNFVTGWQCEKLLWWTVHEPEARELQPDKVLLDLFDQGRQVGELARREFPGPEARFEATYEAHGVRARADILLPGTLIEVKSSTELKEEHVPDAAVQAWVLREAGVDITRVELMHLNKAYRHPGQGSLFVREDITEAVERFLPRVPDLVAGLRTSLDGPLPGRAVGLQCAEPRECCFLRRCWPDDPHHIGTLYRVGIKTAVSYMAGGVHSIWDIPPGKKLPDPARRQLRALQESRIVVEPTLAAALAPFRQPLGFLDFETVSRAIPVWDGLGPWRAAIAQFSYHEEQADGSHTHVGWLAEGPGDPRREAAERLLEATRNASSIATYSSYEKTCITQLLSLFPDLAPAIQGLLDRLVDLLPVVRDNIYHPGFNGSFSLKDVLTPMVPELSYDDLVIVDGRLASVEIARLLFVAHKIPPGERDKIRRDLLDYCERDTWATVRMMARLRELAAATP